MVNAGGPFFGDAANHKYARVSLTVKHVLRWWAFLLEIQTYNPLIRMQRPPMRMQSSHKNDKPGWHGSKVWTTLGVLINLSPKIKIASLATVKSSVAIGPI